MQVTEEMNGLASAITDCLIDRGVFGNRSADDGALHHRDAIDRRGGYPFGRDTASAANQKLRDSDRKLGDEEMMFDDHTEAGPLQVIRQRIDQQRRAMNEVAAKLNMHADRVLGCVPMERRDEPIAASAKGMPAIQAIFIALDDLDSALSDVAVAAGRNTTLA